MNRLHVTSLLFRCALAIVLLAIFGGASSASVIYQYRQEGSSTVIGTLEVGTPPANSDSGWSTADASDLISLFLDDGVFGLGPGNLLLVGTVGSVAISSSDGSRLDGGGLVVTFPTIPAPTPDDPAIDRLLALGFLVPAGGDEVEVATTFTFPNGPVIIGDLFIDGDWDAVRETAVPEPGTFALLGAGLLAAGRSALRRRG